MQKDAKILMTGGHAGATAYALTQALYENKNYNLDLYFIGSKNATEGIASLTLEEEVLPQLGVKFIGITSGRLQRRFTKYTIYSLLKIPIGIVQSFYHIAKIKPDLIVSFGGFASFPVVFCAWFFGIPIVIHEQTSVYGRANKFAEKLATKIALSRNSSLIHFDNNKTVITGNPVSNQISQISLKTKLPPKPTIFITGGSRGSEVINETVKNIITELTSKFNVIHQVGLTNEHKYKSQKNYHVFGRIYPQEWSKYLNQADIIISRAGANVISEILIAKRPSILIPIPWSYMDEQNENAKYAQKSGGVIVLPQNELNPENLLNKIEEVYKNWNKMVYSMNKFKSEDINASYKLADLIFKLI